MRVQRDEPGVERLLSLAPLTVLELDPAEVVTCAAAAGYDAVGLRLIPATEQEPVRPTIGATPLIRETRRRLDDSGLRLLDVEVVRLVPETVVRSDFEGILETGAFLGAGEVLATGYDPDRQRTADNLAELSLLAAEYGMTVNIEPMPWTAVRDVHEGAALVAQCPVPTGLLIDAIHYDRAGTSPAELEVLPREWIRYIQICDAPAEQPATMSEIIHQGRCARLLPGAGGIGLVSMLRALPAEVPVSVEAPLHSDAPATVRAALAAKAARDVLALAADSDWSPLFRSA
ncbi:TIM barrel protein [Arthrobacter sp. SLBN-53]|uniref:sugar phosphate isomerase/epimerase family protein n=1 Tax=Arthrobacter sp. SLBN-53 TaxID=2768412 RepID=UPI00115465AE|nr:TIM barrel protein [Arthrobacter sp. SLBN-53]TQK31906.1 sugar phosphate isomerase/epimerase [Arthrobacter sp. SLBN-53]